MRFAVSGEHRSFYQKHQAIELEGLCTAEQLQSLSDAIDNALSQRLNLKLRNLSNQMPETLFAAGRDLWRINDTLRRFVTQTSLANIAAEITDTRMLRLGYVQYFPMLTPNFQGMENPFVRFLQNKYTLEDSSCLQGVQSGLLLCLKGSAQRLEIKKPADANMPIDIFSDTAGNGFLFSSKTPINWQQLFQRSGQRYLLIVYTQVKSVYIYKETDPQAHSLKQWGYCLGDKLIDRLNPIVHR